MSRTIIQKDLTNTSDPKVFQDYAGQQLADIVSELNGGLTFENFDAQTTTVAFTAINTPVTVPHNLKRAPVYFIVIDSDSSGVVWRYSGNSTDVNNIYLVCNVAPQNIRIVML